MRPSAAAFLADGWRLWRTDWRALTGIAGPFLFLPILALHMLIPPGALNPPKGPEPGPTFDEASAIKYLDALNGWFGSVGIWMLASLLLAYFAALAIAHLYLARPGQTVGQALAAALARVPVYLVAAMLAAFPVMLGYMLLILPAFFVLGRLALTAPVIAAEPGTGPIRALSRSVTLTRGHSLTMMSVMMTVVLAGILLRLMLGSLDDWLLANAPNQVLLVVLDILLAAASAAGSLATILVEVSAYRRLAPSSAA